MEQMETYVQKYHKRERVNKREETRAKPFVGGSVFGGTVGEKACGLGCHVGCSEWPAASHSPNHIKKQVKAFYKDNQRQSLPLRRGTGGRQGG